MIEQRPDLACSDASIHCTIAMIFSDGPVPGTLSCRSERLTRSPEMSPILMNLFRGSGWAHAAGNARKEREKQTHILDHHVTVHGCISNTSSEEITEVPVDPSTRDTEALNRRRLLYVGEDCQDGFNKARTRRPHAPSAAKTPLETTRRQSLVPARSSLGVARRQVAKTRNQPLFRFLHMMWC